MTNNFKNFSFDKSHLDINPEAHNLAVRQRDYAVFLPSISAIYTKIVSKTEYHVREKMPQGLPLGLKDLDFLNPANNLFYYPAALYSAGHAILDINDSYTQECMVQQRDRKNTIMLGDSGGFQAATGVLKYPWHPKPKQSAEDHMHDKDAMRMKILRWLEATSDYSMLLDWPTYALVKYGSDPVTGVSLHPSLKSFADCLNGSLENHAFFAKHRTPGATKFLNVLQGRNMEEGDIWWEATKDLPFESWAFSNVQASNFTVNLRRLIIMRDTHYLQGREWLHYLGNGKIPAGCALTTLQRSLRKYVDPNLTVSFDAASAFVMAAKGQSYYGHDLSHKNMGFKSGPIPDEKELKNSPESLNEWLKRTAKNCTPIPSKIGDRITLGDICVRDYNDLKYKKVEWTKKELESDRYKFSPEGRAGDKFRWTRAYKEYLAHSHENGGLFDFGSSKFEDEREKYQIKWPSSLDGFSYVLIMNHSVETHINAIQLANEYQDLPIDQAKKYITSDLLEFKDLCPEIFTSERPMDIIMKHENLLQKITGMDADNSVSKDIADC